MLLGISCGRMTLCSSFLARFLVPRLPRFPSRSLSEVLEESEEEDELLELLEDSEELELVTLAEVVPVFLPGPRFLPLGGCT